MLEAKSIYLGGFIISAENCTYDKTIDLGLICPFCNKAVFLVGKAVRQKGDRLEQVRPHFSHFKADAEDGKVCEARSLTKEGREYLQKLSPESRGQRLSLFNRRLWDMIREDKDIPINLDRRMRQKLPSQMIDQTTAMIKHCKTHWNDDRAALESYLKRCIEGLVLEAAKPYLEGNLPETVTDLFEQWRNELDNKMQYAIAAEVVDYLGAASASECFEKLIKVSMMDAYEASRLTTAVQMSSSAVHKMAVSTIALTQWEKVVAKFSKPQPGQGFKK